MTEAESLTIRLLEQINQKLEKLLAANADRSPTLPSDTEERLSLLERAQKISDMTPQLVPQTDAVDLLHEDRSR